MPKIQKELTALTQRYRKHYQITDEEQLLDRKKHEEELRLREAIRRFYLLFSLCESDADIDRIMNQIFGESYADYRDVYKRQALNASTIILVAATCAGCCCPEGKDILRRCV